MSSVEGAVSYPADRSVRAAALTAFRGMVLRDLRVLTRQRGRFLVRTISQPLLLVFVFTYVLPTIGQGLEGGQRSFTDILVPGVVAIAVLIKGVQAVALPLVQDFGYTREIEDRVMAPLPVWAVAGEKIVAGAVHGLLAAVIASGSFPPNRSPSTSPGLRWWRWVCWPRCSRPRSAWCSAPSWSPTRCR